MKSKAFVRGLRLVDFNDFAHSYWNKVLVISFFKKFSGKIAQTVTGTDLFNPFFLESLNDLLYLSPAQSSQMETTHHQVNIGL